jgi:PAS domain S-box-containing protein
MSPIIQKPKQSLFLVLGLIIVFTVMTSMATHATHSYISTKNRLIEDMQKSSDRTIETLKSNLAHLIASYAVNEYNNLILNELTYKNIFAIVIEDYNMGNILGKTSQISGKIRNEQGEIIDYNDTNEEHKKLLDNCYYSKVYDIEKNSEKLGKIRICISDTIMQKELKEIIFTNIQITFGISLFLIFVLFFTIKWVILKPIFQIITTIDNSSTDGIPHKVIPKSNFYEMNNLIISINTMIHTIKNSRMRLKQNRDELAKSLDLQKTILDSVGYMLIRTDKKGIIKQINKETEKILGYRSDELVNNYTPELIHLKSEVTSKANELSEKFNKKIVAGFEVFVTKTNLGQESQDEWTFITKNNQHIPVLLNVKALKDKKGEIYGYLGIAKDITQQKLLESQAKLASMGEMIGNIAHQWRQPLSVISTVASGIKVKSEFGQFEPEQLFPDMDVIIGQTQYLSKTIDDFRNFLRESKDKESINLSKVVETSLSIVQSTMIDNHIDVILNLKSNGLLHAFPNQLVQAIINILNNAKDALKDNVKEENLRLIFVETKEVDAHLILTIKDNAGGIPKHIMPKIFEPYFTTKHKSVGTGIGLSMTHKIITEQHQAVLEVDNETFEYQQQFYTGACFTITFAI